MVSTQDSDSCDPSSILGEIITEQFGYKHSQTALLAQLVERRSYEPQVMGSNPIQSTSGVNTNSGRKTNLLVARPTTRTCRPKWCRMFWLDYTLLQLFELWMRRGQMAYMMIFHSVYILIHHMSNCLGTLTF